MRLSAVMVVCLTTGQAIAQVPTGFEVVFVTEADVVRSPPDMNNGSVVVWAVGASETQFIIEGFIDGIVRTLIDDPITNTRPSINDNGDIVVRTASSPGGPFDVGIHYADGSVLVLDVIDAVNFVDINNSGQVAWVEDFSGNSTHTEVFLFDGMGTQQISFNGLQNLLPRLNESGSILFSSFDFDSRVWSVHLFDGEEIALVHDKGVIAQFGDINDSGHVVWAEFEGGSGRIVLLEEGETCVVAEGAVSRPTINNRGDIQYGEWNTQDQLTDTVLRTVSGVSYTLPNLGLNCEGSQINGRAEVVWRGVDLSSGNSAILILRRIGPVGDFDHDCHRDVYDMAILENCYTGDGAGPPQGLLAECARADFDRDGDIDHDDIAGFLRVVTGPSSSIGGCTP